MKRKHGRKRTDTATTELSLSAGESVDIPLKVKHRVRNHADDHLVIIEIQTGTRCDDSDIERFEDLYGRI